MSDAKKIHSEIIGLRAERPLVVFDLDSTLFNVSYRTQNILRAFATEEKFRQKYPEETENLKTIQVLAKDWGLRQALERHSFKATVGFFEDLRLYWREKFFSNDYLHCDQPYTGAVDYVTSLAEAGLRVVYLTGRDRQNMFDGTVKSLNQHGFPLRDHSNELFMKPAKGSVEDEDFKAIALEEFRKEHQHIFFFENEPVILNKVLRVIPGLRAIYMDTVHCGREVPPPGLPVIPGVFER